MIAHNLAQLTLLIGDKSGMESSVRRFEAAAL
jgi:hypothetical protein